MLVVPASTSCCCCCWQTLPYWSALGHSAKLKAFSSWWVPGRTADWRGWRDITIWWCMNPAAHSSSLSKRDSSSSSACLRNLCCCCLSGEERDDHAAHACRRRLNFPFLQHGGERKEVVWCSLFCLWIAAPFEKESEVCSQILSSESAGGTMLLVGACFRRGETSFSSLSRHFSSSSSRSSQDLQNLATFSLSLSILQLISLTRVPIEREKWPISFATKPWREPTRKSSSGR